VSVWPILQLDSDVASVAVMGSGTDFNRSTRADDLFTGSAGRLGFVGPKSNGLLKPCGLALTGESFDQTIDLLIEADVVLVADDVRIGDSSGDLGIQSSFAPLLNELVPTGEISRMGLLGSRGAMTAERAVTFGLAQAIVDRRFLRTELEARLRHLAPPEA
jgi:hypothetical protein